MDDEHRDRLLEMIRKLLDGRWTFEQFADGFWDYYLRKVPQDVLSERDERFFEMVQQRIDRTDEDPDPEDRCEQGYLDFEEFVEWLRERMVEYDSGAELDLEWW